MGKHAKYNFPSGEMEYLPFPKTEKKPIVWPIWVLFAVALTLIIL